ncbi:MAG: hypothetical protein JNM70_18185 [Anaerolineae bacterium]|nr:hypothetical protein [Anaerolineae bacterium]
MAAQPVNADPIQPETLDKSPTIAQSILKVLAAPFHALAKLWERDLANWPVEGMTARDLRNLEKRLENAANYELGRRIPLTLLLLVVIPMVWLVVWYFFGEFIYERLLFLFFGPNAPHPSVPFWTFLVILYALMFLGGLSIYYFKFMVPLRVTRQLLRQVLQTEEEEAEGKLAEAERIDRRADRLRSLSSRVLLDNEERGAKAQEHLRQVDDIVAKANSPSTPAQSNTLVLKEAEYRLAVVDELILREQNELRGQRLWQYGSMLAVVLYIIVLVAAALAVRVLDQAAQINALFNTATGGRSAVESQFNTVIILGVPLSVLVWGAAGSLAAILYRFYKTPQGERVQWGYEFRWLLARPLIGIIMAAVAYVALFAGVFVLEGAATGMETAAGVRRRELFYVIAFLAGFSDKFYEGIIELLTSRVASPKTETANGTNTTTTTTTTVVNPADQAGTTTPANPVKDPYSPTK